MKFKRIYLKYLLLVLLLVLVSLSFLTIMPYGMISQTQDANSPPANISITVEYGTPVQLGQYFDVGEAYDVQVVGNLAYVADGDDGLEIFNVVLPLNPTEVGQVPLPGFAYDVHVVGDLAFVADYPGLYILNVSNPSNPFQIASWGDGGWAWGVYVVGDLAYVTELGGTGFEILNVSDPTTPFEIGEYAPIGWAYGVQVIGELAYITTFEGLKILNVSDPTTPFEIGQYNTSADVPRDLQVVGELVYIANSGNGLVIVNVSDPTNPTEIGQFQDGGVAEKVHVVGNLAYIADSGDGLEVLNVSNPTNPFETTQFFDGGSAKGVQVAGGLIYVADSGDGLEILEHAPGSSSPSDAIYELGSTNKTIDWFLIDDRAAGDYYVLRNGTEVVPLTPWLNNATIKVSVNTSVVGVWNYTLLYYDNSWISGAPDTVIITIQDTTAPTSNSPGDASYIQGETGKSIGWILSDNYGVGSYRVLRGCIAVISWRSWSNATLITVPIDTSSIGTWIYTIEFNDSVGNLGTLDQVVITIDPRPFFPDFLWVPILVGVVAVVLLVWILKYRAQKGSK